MRHLSKRFAVVGLVVAALLPASVGLVGCGAPSGGGSGSSSKSAQREAAETNLRKIDSTLDQVVTAYKAGDMATAARLADQATKLYEGSTETTVTAADPAVERQLDPLLAATLPQMVKGSGSASDVESTCERGKSLVDEALSKLQQAG
jgi:hypothetical protein